MLERDPHTVSIWSADFIKGRPEAVAFAQTGGPPALEPVEQTALKAAVQAKPQSAGRESDLLLGRLSGERRDCLYE